MSAVEDVFVGRINRYSTGAHGLTLTFLERPMFFRVPRAHPHFEVLSAAVADAWRRNAAVRVTAQDDEIVALQAAEAAG